MDNIINWDKPEFKSNWVKNDSDIFKDNIITKISNSEFIEVVRCKDCVWMSTEECLMWGQLIKALTDMDYCSFGVKNNF